MLKNHFKLTFVDINPEVITALSRHGNMLRYCDFRIGDIFKEHGGSLVSPANSYGDMRGGIDKQYSKRFAGLEGRLKSYIESYHGGRLEIGKAQIVPTHDEKFPYVIVTPTVENPGDQASEGSVLKAMEAVLKETLWLNNTQEISKKIEQLLCPGLGTGSGGLAPGDAARAIATAYRQVQSNTRKLLADNPYLKNSYLCSQQILGRN
ncbi:MAG: macro domain-containing protein [Candidatus Woesearchaeota archaeon]